MRDRRAIRSEIELDPDGFSVAAQVDKRDPAELHGLYVGDLPSVNVNADGSASIEFDADELTPSEVAGL